MEVNRDGPKDIYGDAGPDRKAEAVPSQSAKITFLFIQKENKLLVHKVCDTIFLNDRKDRKVTDIL
jgi:hypothetical protein